MKLHWKINLVVNMWLTLLLATSNLIALDYTPFEGANFIVTVVLLSLLGAMNLGMIIYHITKRLTTLDAFSRFLRR